MEFKEESQTKNAERYFQTANQLKQEGKLEQAIDVYRRAIETAPKVTTYYQGLADSLAQIGKLDDAARCYHHAIYLNPEWFMPYYSLGIVLEKQGETENSIANYRKAIELNPSFAWSYYALGNVFNLQGDFNKAISYYQKAIKAHPADKSFVFHIKLGDVLMHQGNLDLAIQYYHKAKKLNPDDSQAKRKLELAYDRKKRWENITVSKTLSNITLDFTSAEKFYESLLDCKYLLSKRIKGSLFSSQDLSRLLHIQLVLLSPKVNFYSRLLKAIQVENVNIGSREHFFDNYFEFITMLKQVTSEAIDSRCSSLNLHSSYSNLVSKSDAIEKRSIQRISICLISNTSKSNVSRLISSIIRSLQNVSSNFYIQALITNELDATLTRSFSLFDSHITLESIDKARELYFIEREELKKLMEETDIDLSKTKVEFAFLETSIDEYLTSVCRMLLSFAPDVVLIPNQSLTFSFSSWIYRNFPSVFMQTALQNTPCYDYDMYLYHDTIPVDAVNPERWAKYSTSITPFGNQSISEESQQIIQNITKPVKCITVGNRLHSELNRYDFMQDLMTFLERSSNVVWIVVGLTSEKRKDLVNKFPEFERLTESGKIFTLSYEENLASLYSQCDIYINPPRQGGGLSIALAVSQGLAVLSFVKNDSNPYLLPNMIFEDKEAYFKRLSDLSEDRLMLYRTKERQLFKYRFIHTPEDSATQLLIRLNQAKKIFNYKFSSSV